MECIFVPCKEHDGENDKSSNLNREEVFRLAIGPDSEAYFKLFGQKPSRPDNGGAVKTGHDFSKLNELTPHPVYAWMNWAQVLCPTRETLKEIFPLIEKAFQSAVDRFDKKTATKPTTRKR